MPLIADGRRLILDINAFRHSSLADDHPIYPAIMATCVATFGATRLLIGMIECNSSSILQSAGEPSWRAMKPSSRRPLPDRPAA